MKHKKIPITLYHEVSQDMINAVLQRGLVLGTAGSKTDASIHQTDIFLNEHRPKHIVDAGVDRETNIYCYLAKAGFITDISSGEAIPLDTFIHSSRQRLVRVNVVADKCYISNLDVFDQVKSLLESGDRLNAGRLAEAYWASIQPLSEYKESISRPEAMVTYSVPPKDITVQS